MKKHRMIALVMAAAMTMATISPALATEETQEQQGADGGSWAAAGISNVIYIPSKGLSCAASGVIWLGVMTLTGGTRYKAAGDFVHEACTGKWVIKGEDMDTKAKDNWFLE